MTQTTAIIINAILGVGLVAALTYVMRIPFRLGRSRTVEHALYVHGNEDERELSRAA
jgi:hypothetical protein